VIEALQSQEFSASRITGRSIEVPVLQTKRLASFIERVVANRDGLPWRFDTMVIDFVHGDDGRWWMIGIRDYVLSDQSYKAVQAAIEGRKQAKRKQRTLARSGLGEPTEDESSAIRAPIVDETMPGRVSAEVRKRAVQGSICQFCRLRFHPGERVALFDPDDAATAEEAQLLRQLQGVDSIPDVAPEGKDDANSSPQAKSSLPNDLSPSATNRIIRPKNATGRQLLQAHARA